MFSFLYKKTLEWSRHRYAVWYLSLLSFAESSFFPVPPDVMLAPMSLATPKKAFRFALLTTIMSVLGGLFGYAIGLFGFDFVAPWLHELGYWEKYLKARDWFDTWGFWAVFLAGFSPIPYKVFTITAGALSMAILPFVFASFIGRGTRFFLVAILLAWGGESLENLLHTYVNRIGWATVILIGAAVIIYQM